MYCIEKILYFKISVMSPIPLLKTTYYIVDTTYFIPCVMCSSLYTTYCIFSCYIRYKAYGFLYSCSCDTRPLTACAVLYTIY